jgi:limonene-1,2-epoxide hydrolase
VSVELSELQACYARHRQRHDAGDWVGLGELFTEDGSYFDAIYRWSHGHAAVRAFLERSMRGLDEWEFPIHAVGYDADSGTILTHWTNRLPGLRPDGTHYDVPGVSVITYGGGGLISRQMDLYDTGEMMRTIEQWSTDHGGALPYPTD